VLYETYKRSIGKYLFDAFPIQSGLKQGNTLSPLLPNFALEYSIRKGQENKEGLELNGTQILVFDDDINLMAKTQKFC
jgi:hypothetical protein